MNESERLILESRTRALALPAAPEVDHSQAMALVTFSLSSQRYGVRADLVRVAAKMEAFTRVPGSAPHIAGVTHVGGEIFAVLDLSVLTRTRSAGITDRAYVVLIGRGRPEIGLLADFVEELAHVPRGDIGSPDLVPARIQPYALGIARDGLSVLDGGAILDAPELWSR